jgi:CMP-N-acetylneuraminic acid synthetase
MIDDKKIIGITLARGGSKSIKNKNLAVINGKSLLERAINCGINSKYIDEYYVSSDCDIILKEAERLGAKTIKRPAVFASDIATSASAIEHALLRKECDYCIEIMCTSPFKNSEDVDNCILKLHETQADSVVAVKRIYDHHPSRVKYIENDELKDFYPEIRESRRQDLLPESYVRCGSAYAFTIDSFRKTRSRYGGPIVRPYIMNEKTSINIDEEIDLIIAEYLGKKYDL